MKAVLNALDLKKFFASLENQFKSKVVNKGFELVINLPKASGKGQISGFDCGAGFTLININIDLYKLICIELKDEELHVLRYLFVRQGYIVHFVSGGFRYRLSAGSASIVARRASTSSQELIIPAQNNLELTLLQIDTKKYTDYNIPDVLNIPAELADVLLNRSEAEYFFYQSAFSLGIHETLKELNEKDSEGLVKRFFIESKALELLWMQTENYKNEQLYGYDRFLIRNTDIKLLSKAREIIRNNLETNLTLKSLARSSGTNETKLKIGLKKMYSKTFGEILRNDRLTKARLILEEGSLSIKETAAKCGYTSVGVFSRRFKEKFGVLPGVYLKSR